MILNQPNDNITIHDWKSNIKVTATIGPASSSVDVLETMIKNGLSVARLNFSHGTHEYHSSLITSIRQAASNLSKNIAIMLDTKGPEIRTGKLSSPSITLQQGQELVLTMDYSFIGTASKISVSHSNLYNEVKQNDKIFIDDGLIRLTVKSIQDKEIYTTVENTAILKETKGVNIPGAHLSLPVLTDKDKADLKFGVEHKVDFIAASFIQKAEDVIHIKDFLKDCGSEKEILIYSKIECQAGVDDFDNILKESDGIMVARGDLGIEVPLTHVIELQKIFVKKCVAVRKPVIVATQMLQSMVTNPSPTRAEVSDVYNAVLDGTDCVMLSGESAGGKYPAESVLFQVEISNVAKKRKEKFDKVIEVVDGNCLFEKYTNIVEVVKSGELDCLVITEEERLGRWLSLIKNCFTVVVKKDKVREQVEKVMGKYEQAEKVEI